MVIKFCDKVEVYVMDKASCKVCLIGDTNTKTWNGISDYSRFFTNMIRRYVDKLYLPDLSTRSEIVVQNLLNDTISLYDRMTKYRHRTWVNIMSIGVGGQISPDLLTRLRVWKLIIHLSDQLKILIESM